MLDPMIVEAISSMQRTQAVQSWQSVQDPLPVADPAAVAKFQAAMAPDEPAAIPMASEVSAIWRSAQENYQGMVHRIKALTETSATRSLSAVELGELQYEVANLAFQQEVVAKVADKASTAIQTLIKNQ